MNHKPSSNSKETTRGKARAPVGEPLSPSIIRRAPDHQEISVRAEALWRRMGCPHSCDVAIWLEAEDSLVHPGSGSGENRGIGIGGAPFDSGKIIEALNAQFPGTTGPATTSL